MATATLFQDSAHTASRWLHAQALANCNHDAAIVHQSLSLILEGEAVGTGILIVAFEKPFSVVCLAALYDNQLKCM